MTQTIIVKNSSTPGKEPPSLAPGELGVNLADQKLYTADQEGHVFELGAPGDPGVTKLVAGTNITLTPATGLGEVKIDAAGGSTAPVQSVNGETGDVVLDAADVGAATAEQGDKADTALQPGSDISELNNDAGYITDAGVTKLVAGANITLTPADGLGQVTIEASGGGGSVGSLQQVTDVGNTTTNDIETGAIKCTAIEGNGTALTGVTHPGDNVSSLNNDAGYLASGDDISLLTNNAGYLTDAPSDGQEYCRKNASWSVITGGGGGGSTNLGNTPTTTQVTITSSTGSDTVVAAASGSQAGVMTTAQVNTLSSASANASQALSDASAAQSTASQASSTASQASTTASQAQSTANSAATTASDAQSRAIAAQNTADACVQKSGDTMTGRLTFGSGADLFAQSTLTLYGSNSANSIVLDGSGATVSNTSSGYAAGIRYAQSNAWIGWKYIASQGAEFIYNNTPWFTVQAQYSDARLKKDVTPLEPEGGAIELVNELNPVQYRWKDAEEPWYCQRQLAIDPEGTYKWGFIAQEVGQTIPASFLLADVTEDRPDPIADYDLRAVVALLTKAVQDLSAEVAALKSAADS